MFVVSVYSLFVGDCEGHYVYPFTAEDKARELFNKKVESFRSSFHGKELTFDEDEDIPFNAHWESGDGDVFDIIITECSFCD